VTAPGPAPAPVAVPARAGRLRRPSRRSLLTALAAALLLLALVAVRVLVGTPMVPVDLALRVIGGEQIPGISFIVMDHRLPTAAVALLAGVAFGLSGTVFQTLLRNPLASPDVIGVTLGASAGAVIAMAFFAADGRALFWCALLGGLATAALLMIVAGVDRPGSAGAVDNRFVLVGIGIAAALSALVSYLLTRLSLQSAGDAMHWLIGSLSSSTWERAAVLAIALAVLIPALSLLVVRLRILQLGDDTATSLGLPVPRTRIALILVAVTLSALTVAVTGPLSFVAFLAGPIARMLAGRPSFALAAVVGAVIVLLADIAGQNLFGGTELPAGVVTGALGAPFLLWMLTRTPTSGSGR
jgi:iron complex transport system permease protein